MSVALQTYFNVTNSANYILVCRHKIQKRSVFVMLNMYKFSILIGILVILSIVTGCGGGPSCPDFIENSKSKENTSFHFHQSLSIKILDMVFEKEISIGYSSKTPNVEFHEPEWDEFPEIIHEKKDYCPESNSIPTPTYAPVQKYCTPIPTFVNQEIPIPARTPYHLEFLTVGMVADAKNVGIVELIGIEYPKIFINGWVPTQLRDHLVNNGFIITDENDCDFILCDLNLNKITKEDFENNEVVLITTKDGRGIVSGTMKLENKYLDDDMSFYKDKSLYTTIKIVGMYYKK
jgi:hypothetical protein